MAGTVVGTFIGVDEVRKVFGNQIIEKGVEIGPGGRVGIFHDDETRTGMLDEDSDLPVFNTLAVTAR